MSHNAMLTLEGRVTVELYNSVGYSVFRRLSFDRYLSSWYQI